MLSPKPLCPNIATRSAAAPRSPGCLALGTCFGLGPHFADVGKWTRDYNSQTISFRLCPRTGVPRAALRLFDQARPTIWRGARAGGGLLPPAETIFCGQGLRGPSPRSDRGCSPRTASFSRRSNNTAWQRCSLGNGTSSNLPNGSQRQVGSKPSCPIIIDTESGERVTVFYQPSTGERRYVAG